MIFVYVLIFTAIFSYTAIWLWYIKAYMQYDFGSYYRNKHKNIDTDEQEELLCKDYLKEKHLRCNTVLKMIFLAGPLAWIVMIIVYLVGKLVSIVDKKYEETGTSIL